MSKNIKITAEEKLTDDLFQAFNGLCNNKNFKRFNNKKLINILKKEIPKNGYSYPEFMFIRNLIDFIDVFRKDTQKRAKIAPYGDEF